MVLSRNTCKQVTCPHHIISTYYMYNMYLYFVSLKPKNYLVDDTKSTKLYKAKI